VLLTIKENKLKGLKMKKLAKVCLIGLFCVLVSAGCGRLTPVYQPEFPVQARNLDHAQGVIQQSLISRGWTVRSSQPGKMVADIDIRGKHGATIDVNYTPTQVAIKLRDSRNLKEGFDREGTPVIHKNYNGWVQNLQQDIQRNLN